MLITMHQAVNVFLKLRDNHDIFSHLLNPTDIEVITHIVHILKLAHATQELLSGEKTPTLSIALPAYQLVVKYWTEMQGSYPELRNAIQAGIDKINDYVSKSQESQIHVLAMGEHTRASFGGLLADAPGAPYLLPV